MTDFRQIYNEMSDQMHGNQKKIQADSCIEIFFGYSFDGNLRLSFLSRSAPPVIESTKILHVVQGCETANTYWTSFDLMDFELKEAYFSFCENLIESVIGIKNEYTALSLLKRRFITWKTLFQKNSGQDISKERLRGLFGELTVLKDIIAVKYGTDTAIRSWGGPDMQSKDFTVDGTWYEVKCIGANAGNIHIPSLTQLFSEQVGHLAVVKAEAVSAEYGCNCKSVIDLIKDVIIQIDDERTESLFMNKIQSLGVDVFEAATAEKYDIKSVTLFKVTEGFPRLTPKNLPYSGITDVSYSVSLASVSKFKEA